MPSDRRTRRGRRTNAARTLATADTETTGTRTSANPAPDVDTTQLTAKLLTERVGHVRGVARQLTSETEELHKDTTFTEWTSRTAARGKEVPGDLLRQLADLGFAWRDIARMVGVSVAAVQKWRRGERTTGDNRRHLAGLLAACDLVADHYLVSEVASWFEMPLVHDVPVTPADLYSANRTDLVFDYASGHSDPATVLSHFNPDWREQRSDFAKPTTCPMSSTRSTSHVEPKPIACGNMVALDDCPAPCSPSTPPLLVDGRW